VTRDGGIESLLRSLAPQILGVLVGRYGDFDAAEDAVQEALLTAAVRWPVDGTPDNPRGWLIQTASRKLYDQTRSDQARRRREQLAARLDPSPPEPSADELSSDVRDDALTLLFLCCHPSLTPTSAIALTLRAVGGLTTAQVASAFLVPEATMAQRISRAKQRIKAAGAQFRMPTGAEWSARLRTVLHVLYLIFNEGYVSSDGASLHRVELSTEAIRLARSVHRILPEDGEVAGLLALMLLTDARRPARADESGEIVPLAEQDRTLWDRGQIVEGTAILDRAVRRGAVGEYQLQAAIAALHDRAGHFTDTDWPQILALYDLLSRMTGSAVVELNRAIAAAMVYGPEHGLTLLEPLDAKLPGHRLAAVRAHLYEMAGDRDMAIGQYRAAAAAATSLPERRYLTTRSARLHADPPGRASTTQ
jgi:RNA polymerase sigma factor (sigma-70 family)